MLRRLDLVDQRLNATPEELRNMAEACRGLDPEMIRETSNLHPDDPRWRRVGGAEGVRLIDVNSPVIGSERGFVGLKGASTRDHRVEGSAMIGWLMQRVDEWRIRRLRRDTIRLSRA